MIRLKYVEMKNSDTYYVARHRKLCYKARRLPPSEGKNRVYSANSCLSLIAGVANAIPLFLLTSAKTNPDSNKSRSIMGFLRSLSKGVKDPPPYPPRQEGQPSTSWADKYTPKADEETAQRPSIP